MFDDVIRNLRAWFELRRNAPDFRTTILSTLSDDEAELNSEKSAPSIILKEDTYVELGHPSAGSCSLCAATLDTSLVRDRALTIVGPGIAESEGKALPFAQIVIGACSKNVGETSLVMDKIAHSACQMEGYMLRSVPDRIWARVSKEAAGAGFSLEGLGRRLYSPLRQCPGVAAIEIFLVTSSREGVDALDRIVLPAREKLGKIQTCERLPDGTYECTTGLDCAECPEKPVCDNIRQVITIRKGDRIITFQRSDGRVTETTESSGAGAP